MQIPKLVLELENDQVLLKLRREMSRETKLKKWEISTSRISVPENEKILFLRGGVVLKKTNWSANNIQARNKTSQVVSSEPGVVGKPPLDGTNHDSSHLPPTATV